MTVKFISDTKSRPPRTLCWCHPDGTLLCTYSRGSVSPSLLIPPSEWSCTVQEISHNWQNKEVTWDCTMEKGRLSKWTFWQIRSGVVQARGSHQVGTQSGGSFLPADKLRKDHTPEKLKGMKASQLGILTIFLKMCFKFPSHNRVPNLQSLLHNLRSIWHQELNILTQ